MNKLDMAHDFAMKLVGNPATPLKTMESIVDVSWKYADAMQAEADKREHKHMFLNGGPCICGVTMQDVANKPIDMDNWMEIRSEEEWQPDWSQATAKDIIAWDMMMDGQARWIASDGGYYLAPSFGYTGDWSDSLRKRPQ